MILKQITFHNFRNFNQKIFKINPRLTAILGDNARGKTNLLEGIYFILKGEGFRESKEEQLIVFNQTNGSVEANLEDLKTKYKANIRINLGINSLGLEKIYFLEKTKKGRYAYLKNLLPVVLFSPDQIEIIDRTMSFRREYFDKLISGTDSEYKKRLTSYNQALRKRNKILESGSYQENIRPELEFWNKYLIDQGVYLIEKRTEYTKYLNENRRIDLKEFFIDYRPNSLTHERFEENLSKEMLIRKTITGPHRDDYYIFMASSQTSPKKDIHLYGSRSEQRLALFWLKINELKYLENHFKQKPILLLDDIFSELDKSNQKLVFDLIEDYQTVVTSTEKDLVKLIKLSNNASYDAINL